MKLITIILSLLVTTICFADVYVALDKQSNEPKGMVDIKPENLADWAKTYTMKEADESYRGKAGYEIKVDGENLRHATKHEIDVYKDQQKQLQEAAKKSDALVTLGLTANDIEKIKKLPNGNLG
jgi:hypothetical protein